MQLAEWWEGGLQLSGWHEMPAEMDTKGRIQHPAYIIPTSFGIEPSQQIYIPSPTTPSKSHSQRMLLW